MQGQFYNPSSDYDLFIKCKQLIETNNFSLLLDIDNILNNKFKNINQEENFNNGLNLHGCISLALYYIYYILLDKKDRCFIKSLHKYITFENSLIINNIIPYMKREIEKADKIFTNDEDFMDSEYILNKLSLNILYNYCNLNEKKFCIKKEDICNIITQFFYEANNKITDNQLKVIFIYLGNYDLDFDLYTIDKMYCGLNQIVENIIRDPNIIFNNVSDNDKEAEECFDDFQADSEQMNFVD